VFCDVDAGAHLCSFERATYRNLKDFAQSPYCRLSYSRTHTLSLRVISHLEAIKSPFLTSKRLHNRHVCFSAQILPSCGTTHVPKLAHGVQRCSRIVRIILNRICDRMRTVWQSVCPSAVREGCPSADSSKHRSFQSCRGVDAAPFDFTAHCLYLWLT
jgi:hypothetical protein